MVNARLQQFGARLRGSIAAHGSLELAMKAAREPT